jgi:hypothetical protein
MDLGAIEMDLGLVAALAQQSLTQINAAMWHFQSHTKQWPFRLVTSHQIGTDRPQRAAGVTAMPRWIEWWPLVLFLIAFAVLFLVVAGKWKIK